MPRSAAVRLFPMDQLSRGVPAVIPAPYRSPIILPFHVTTKAAVIAAAGWNAVSTAARIAAVSSSGASARAISESRRGFDCCAAAGTLVNATMARARRGRMVNGAPFPSLRQWLIRVPDHAVREPRAVWLLSEDHEAAPCDNQLRARIGDPFPGVREVAAPVDFRRLEGEGCGLSVLRQRRQDRCAAAYVRRVRRHPHGVRRVDRGPR